MSELELNWEGLEGSDKFKRALEYAYAAVVLRPYGRTLGQLLDRANYLYDSMNYEDTRFWSFWDDLEGDIFSKNREPFSTIQLLLKSYGPDLGYQRLQEAKRKAVEKIKKEWHLELS